MTATDLRDPAKIQVQVLEPPGASPGEILAKLGIQKAEA
jgi:hypothetical protein